MKKKIQNQGFLLIEVIVAFSIISVALIAAMEVSQKAIYVGRQSLHTSQASFLLEEGAESVRVLRDNGWANISALSNATNYYPTFSGGTWVMSTTSNPVGIFTRTVTLASVKRDNTTQDISSTGTDDPGTKLITVTASWLEGSNNLSKTLQFYISDIHS